MVDPKCGLQKAKNALTTALFLNMKITKLKTEIN